MKRPTVVVLAVTVAVAVLLGLVVVLGIGPLSFFVPGEGTSVPAGKAGKAAARAAKSKGPSPAQRLTGLDVEYTRGRLVAELRFADLDRRVTQAALVEEWRDRQAAYSHVSARWRAGELEVSAYWTSLSLEEDRIIKKRDVDVTWDEKRDVVRIELRDYLGGPRARVTAVSTGRGFSSGIDDFPPRSSGRRITQDVVRR